MAYWAKAVASLDNPLGSPPTPKQEQEGWAAVRESEAARTRRRQRERDYIAAVEVVFKDHDTVPFADARRGLRKGAGADPYALPGGFRGRGALRLLAAGHRGSQRPDLRAATEERRRSWRRCSPRSRSHPGAAHFLIHAYDFPAIAEQGLSAARRYASIAPDSPHALHMPSHIFSRVGQWQDSIDTQRRARAPHRSWIATSITRSTTSCTRLCSSGATTRRASGSNSCSAVEEAERADAADRVRGAAIPARFALERGDWAAAARLALHPTPRRFRLEALSRRAKR